MEFYCNMSTILKISRDYVMRSVEDVNMIRNTFFLTFSGKKLIEKMNRPPSGKKSKKSAQLLSKEQEFK